MPAELARGKFAASRRTRRICWHVKHSQSLGASKKNELIKDFYIEMLHKGLDFHTLRIYCSSCGWHRIIAHTGCADGKRALVKIFVSRDPAHVLHAKVKEVPINLDTKLWEAKFPGYVDLVTKANEEGLFKALKPYSELLNEKSCPRCKKINNLHLSQEWHVKHIRY